MDRILKIGTRGSPLALKQVEMVKEALKATHPALETEVVIIQTSGDWKPSDGEVLLSEDAGGKAQFAKEIEEALLDGRIDCAVHSMKDMDSHLPEGLVIEHMLEREDPRDALLFADREACKRALSQGKKGVFAIPQDARIGTASVRRAAFLRSRRPDVEAEPFRGNVQTRIDKLRGGQVDVTMLAMAGLKRLGLEDEADLVLEVGQMLPAAAQGAVGVEVRASDDSILSIFSRISHLKTVLCVKAERTVLKALNGSCRSPIGCYAVFEDEDKGGQMRIQARVCSVDGAQVFESDIYGDVSSVEQAQALGDELGLRLKARIPDGVL